MTRRLLQGRHDGQEGRQALRDRPPDVQGRSRSGRGDRRAVSRPTSSGSRRSISAPRTCWQRGRSARRNTTATRPTTGKPRPTSRSPRPIATWPSSTSSGPRSGPRSTACSAGGWSTPATWSRRTTPCLTSIVSLDPLYVYFDVHEQAMLRLKRLMQEGKLKSRPRGEKEVPVQIGLSDEDGLPAPGHRRLHRQPGRPQHRHPAVPGQDRQPGRRARQPLHRPGPVRAGAAADRRPPPRADGPRAGTGDRPGPQDRLRRQGEEGRAGQGRQGREGRARRISPWCATWGPSACCATDTARSRRGSSRATGSSSRGMQRLRPGIEVKPEKYDEDTARRQAAEKASRPRTAGRDRPTAKDAATGDRSRTRRRHRRETRPAPAGTDAPVRRRPSTTPAAGGRPGRRAAARRSERPRSRRS